MKNAPLRRRQLALEAVEQPIGRQTLPLVRAASRLYRLAILSAHGDDEEAREAQEYLAVVRGWIGVCDGRAVAAQILCALLG